MDQRDREHHRSQGLKDEADQHDVLIGNTIDLFIADIVEIHDREQSKIEAMADQQDREHHRYILIKYNCR